jgi:endonuclease/exonuclease/phosphatase (EEP) superfamily protein YafD
MHTAKNVALALGILGAGGLAVASVAGIMGRWWWLLDLCSHFRLQYAILSIPLCAVLASLRAWRSAVVAGIVFALNTSLVAPLFWGGATSIDSERPSLQLVVFNANYHNKNFTEVASYLANTDADVIVLVEATIGMREELEKTLHDYESFGDTRTDAFGMLSFSRLPVKSREMLTLADSLLPAIALDVVKDGEHFSLMGLHTMPPVGGVNAALRDAMMEEATTWAQRHDNAIIAGDFNATPWSFAFADMLEKGKLHNSQRGFGLQTSWPSQLWPMSIPIDHCVHSKSLRTVRRTVGPFLGSDHRPLHLTLGFAKAEP